MFSGPFKMRLLKNVITKEVWCSRNRSSCFISYNKICMNIHRSVSLLYKTTHLILLYQEINGLVYRSLYTTNHWLMALTFTQLYIQDLIKRKTIYLQSIFTSLVHYISWKYFVYIKHPLKKTSPAPELR